MSSSHWGQATPDRDDYDPQSSAGASRRGGGAHRRRDPADQPAYPDDEYPSRPGDYARDDDDGYPPPRRQDSTYRQRRDDYYAPRPGDERPPLTRDYPRRRPSEDYVPQPDDPYSATTRDYPRRRAEGNSPRQDDGYSPPPSRGYPPRRPPADNPSSREEGYRPRRDGDYPPRRPDDDYSSRQGDRYSAPTRDYPPRRAENYFSPPQRDYAPRRADGYAPPGQDDPYSSPTRDYPPRRPDPPPRPSRRPDDYQPSPRGYAPRPDAGYPPPTREYPSRRGDRYAPGPGENYPSRQDGRYPPRPAEPARPPAANSGARDPAGGNLVRSSGVMAVGTLVSRVTGMIRTFVLVAALGTLALGNAYNYANGLPNTVYNLAIGGVLTAVIVPLLVNASKRDSDGGAGYDQRMFTLVTMILAGITLIATLAAAPIALLYDLQATGSERHLLVIFAYFFIPQIFFYGVSSLAGAVLNARGHFAAPMWTPVVNNVVVIAVTVTFMVIAGVSQSVANGTVTTSEVWFLGIGTTAGIVAQTLALVPALRRVGFRWRPRFDFRRYEIAEIGRMSGWMFGYVITTQVAFWVTAAVTSTVDKWAASNHYPVGIGYSAYTNAWLLFQLPYAIVAISVITALLPRMSANAAERKFDLVRSDFSAGVRLGSVIVAPAALVLSVLGPALGVVLLSWGDNSARSAAYQGLVFSVFSLGLMPYMLFQLLLRVFYALHDSRTPALIGLLTMTVNIVTNLIALLIFPKTEVVAALGAGFGLANVAGTLVAWRVLSRRLSGLGGRKIGGSLLRMHAAALPPMLFALAVAIASTAALSTPGETHMRAAIIDAMIVVVGGGGALGLYFAMARILHVSEVTELLKSFRSRLGSAH